MCSWPVASRLGPVQTLVVEPEILFTVADRLDRLADSPFPSAPSIVRRCLADLESAWTGGTAAALAKHRLGQLSAVAEPPPAVDGIPARERDRLNRAKFGGNL